MRAVVLVGGAGTRLRPLTATVPKQMLPIAEVPMIERVLGHLAAHGIEEVVLSLGYRHQAFLDGLPAERAVGLTITPAVEPEPLGTAGAIRFAALATGLAEECLLVVNGDVLTDLDIGSLLAAHAASGAEGTIALSNVDDPTSFGMVAAGEDGRVMAFVEKPPAGAATGGFVNAGTYVLEPSVLDRIPEGRAASIERETFPAMVTDGTLFAMASDAYWTDTGTPERYLQSQLDLLSGRRPGSPCPEAVARDDGVWTVGSAVIDGDVKRPALVGTAAFVHAGAYVENSVVGAGSRVHEGARVRGSVLLPGAVVRADAVVDDSMIGEQAVIGEKARLSGLTVVGPGVELEPGAHLHGARVPAVA